MSVGVLYRAILTEDSDQRVNVSSLTLSPPVSVGATDMDAIEDSVMRLVKRHEVRALYYWEWNDDLMLLVDTWPARKPVCRTIARG